MDIKTTLEEMFASVKDEFTEEQLPAVKELVMEYSLDVEHRLSELLQNKLLGEENGGISNEFFNERVNDEKDILLSEWDSLKIMGLGITEEQINNVANKAFEIFVKATTSQP